MRRRTFGVDAARMRCSSRQAKAKSFRHKHGTEGEEYCTQGTEKYGNVFLIERAKPYEKEERDLTNEINQHEEAASELFMWGNYVKWGALIGLKWRPNQAVIG